VRLPAARVAASLEALPSAAPERRRVLVAVEALARRDVLEQPVTARVGAAAVEYQPSRPALAHGDPEVLADVRVLGLAEHDSPDAARFRARLRVLAVVVVTATAGFGRARAREVLAVYFHPPDAIARCCGVEPVTTCRRRWGRWQQVGRREADEECDHHAPSVEIRWSARRLGTGFPVDAA
jgi:hypothetical protein